MANALSAPTNDSAPNINSAPNNIDELREDKRVACRSTSINFKFSISPKIIKTNFFSLWCLSQKGKLENGKLYFRGENLKRPKKDVEERMDEGEEDEEIDEEDIETFRKTLPIKYFS